MRVGLVLVAAAALVGCATAPDGDNISRRAAEIERLEKDCEGRGGILVPIPGAHNSNEATNYACEFRGVSPKPAR